MNDREREIERETDRERERERDRQRERERLAGWLAILFRSGKKQQCKKNNYMKKMWVLKQRTTHTKIYIKCYIICTVFLYILPVG